MGEAGILGNTALLNAVLPSFEPGRLFQRISSICTLARISFGLRTREGPCRSTPALNARAGWFVLPRPPFCKNKLVRPPLTTPPLPTLRAWARPFTRGGNACASNRPPLAKGGWTAHRHALRRRGGRGGGQRTATHPEGAVSGGVRNVSENCAMDMAEFGWEVAKFVVSREFLQGSSGVHNRPTQPAVYHGVSWPRTSAGLAPEFGAAVALRAQGDGARGVLNAGVSLPIPEGAMDLCLLLDKDAPSWRLLSAAFGRVSPDILASRRLMVNIILVAAQSIVRLRRSSSERDCRAQVG
jgi:hypothetical protein